MDHCAGRFFVRFWKAALLAELQAWTSRSCKLLLFLKHRCLVTLRNNCVWKIGKNTRDNTNYGIFWSKLFYCISINFDCFIIKWHLKTFSENFCRMDLREKKFKWNIPILPIGILDFCKQKLAAPPLGPMSHLVLVAHCTYESSSSRKYNHVLNQMTES